MPTSLLLSRRALLFTTAIVFSAFIALFTGCSKKSSDEQATTFSGGGPKILESSILKKLPSSTFGFLVWDTASEATRNFQKKFPGYLASKRQKLKKLGRDLEQRATNPVQRASAKFIQWLDQENLIQYDPSKPQPTESGLVFLELKEDVPLPGAGMYLKFKKNGDATQKVQSLQNFLNEEQIRTESYSPSSGGTGFSADTGSLSSGAKSPFQKIFVASNGSQIAVATTDTIVSELLSEKEGGGLAALKESKPFKRVMAELPPQGSELTFGYADFDRLVSRAGALLSATGDQKLKASVDNIPVDALALTSQMGSDLLTHVGILFDEGASTVQEVRRALTSPSAQQAFKKLPRDTILSLSASDSFLKSIDQLAKSTKQGKQPSPLALLEGAKGFSLGVMKNDAASLFPGVLLMAETNQSDQLYNFARTQLGAFATGGGGLPNSGWQKTDLNGTPVEYVLSPLGIGAYLARAENSLLLGSSNTTLSAALSAAQDASKSLETEIPQGERNHLNQNPPLFTFYLNSPALAQVVQSVQGNLAMFTGGKNPVDATQLEQIKNMGTMLWSGNYKNDVLKLRVFQKANSGGAAA